ncbi:hypothetical protein FHG87_005551 [Trinorchestia longiramus]|nr:hypothetical protein FHG87_005551 [Trinorchestia longiramus]
MESVVVDDIVSLGKSMGLDVDSDDVEELVEDHRNKLTSEEPQELHREQQEEVVEELSSEKEETATVIEWSAACVWYQVSTSGRQTAGSKPGNEYELFLVSCRELALIGSFLAAYATATCTGDSDGPCIELTSTSPVALDTTIWFTVKVLNYKLSPGELLYYTFEDGLFYKNDFVGSTLEHTWNVTCDKVRYKRFTGYRKARALVYYRTLLIWRQLDTTTAEFHITELLVRMHLLPSPTVQPPCYLLSRYKLTISGAPAVFVHSLS